MKRALLLLAVLSSGCTRKPVAPPLQLEPQKCAPGALRERDPAVCLVVPRGWEETRREKEPAFDRTRLGFQGPDADGPELELELVYFARPELLERDDQAQLQKLVVPPGAKLLARGPTADGNGEYLAYEEPSAQGPVFQARSVIRSAHYRVSCSVSPALKRDEAVLGACRTVSAPP